ncbi:hypothetical protein EVAR_49623_1 [Eumeta japonica]|uniref:Pre-C2HC domain-containing protein n=1 Tax=Eumeta variegata TaxID=151549 RepID=A0A4C1Y0C3_EUMVA|nr:hypothetical protein EVAR_49623_1 [Eumeta japonica]
MHSDKKLQGKKHIPVRSPAPNGRYRAPAPSALTKLFAFCADRRPATLPALPIESPRRRRPPHSTTNNNLLFQGTANPDGPGTTGLGGCSSPIPGVARPPSIIPHSILRTPLASLPWTKIPPCSPGAGGSGPKTPITLEFIQQVLTKALSDIGYEAPQDVVKKLIARVTPVSSRASSRSTSPMKTNKNKNKRQASSSSDEGATCSDSTVVGSDSESENSNTSFTLVEGKNKRALRKALKKAKVARDQPEMDIDPSSAPTSRANDAKPSPAAVQQTQTTSTASVESTRNPVSASTQAVTAKTAPRTGAKPTAPPRPKLPPPIFLRKGANFLQISADCTRLRINYSKAVRTADDGIKIHCPDVETFRSLNKYLVDFKVHFTRLPVHSVHRLCRRDGSPLWLVLAVLPRTEEAKNIFNNLNMVCGLGYPSRGPAQERRSRAVPPLPVVRPRGRQLSCGPALREMFGPTLDQRVPAYS